MIHTKRLFLGLILATSLAASEQERESLRGIRSLGVIVEAINSEVTAQTGLSVEQIRTYVELNLRRTGIGIEKDSGQFLYVNVNAAVERFAKGSVAGATAAIEVQVSQMAILLNQDACSVSRRICEKGENACTAFLSEAKFPVTTWSKGALISADTRDFADVCRRFLTELLDKFLNDYLTVNPGSARGAH